MLPYDTHHDTSLQAVCEMYYRERSFELAPEWPWWQLTLR